VPKSTFVFLTEAGGTIDALALDDSYVYWVNSADGSVKRALKSAAVPQTLATGQAKPTRIAVDSSSAYWTNNLGAAVMTVPKAGGSPTLLAIASEPYAIAIDATDVYWTNRGDRSVMRVPKAGGSPIQVTNVSSAPFAGVGYSLRSLALDSTYVYFIAEAIGPGLATDRLYRAPKTGGAAQEIASGTQGVNPYITSVAVDDTFVYWSIQQLGGPVLQMPKSGGAGTQLGSSPPSAAQDSIASDGCFVYFPGVGPWSGLMRVPRAGGKAYPIGTPGQTLVLDATHAYACGFGSIVRSPL